MQSIATRGLFDPPVSVVLKYNTNHVPAGDPRGGQFAPKEGGASAGGASEKKTPEKDTEKAPEKTGKKPARPTPIKTADIEEAIELIRQGKVVELRDTRQVHTLVTRLAQVVKEMKAKGKKAPNFDLCKVTVPGTNLFCASGLKTEQYPEGIPRLEMPQIAGLPVKGTDADALPRMNKQGEVDGAAAFMTHLESLGIPTETSTIPAAKLRASQAELVGANVAQMMTDETFDPGKDPIFVSRDDYVIDGHHRWAAVVGRDAADGTLGQSTMNIRRVDAPISEILLRANEWSKKFGIAPKTAKKYAWVLKGRGAIHSEKWHRCWTKVQEKGHESSSAAAICTSSLGYVGSINKSHRRRKPTTLTGI